MILEFSELGFIGKLFKSEDLQQFITHALLFFEDKPIDWIFQDFFKEKICAPTDDPKVCRKRVDMSIYKKFHRSQFRHVGAISSLGGKVQELFDFKFILLACPFILGPLILRTVHFCQKWAILKIDHIKCPN